MSRCVEPWLLRALWAAGLVTVVVMMCGCDPDDIGPAQKPIPPASSPAVTR